MTCYEERDELLVLMGFGSYEAYLGSQLWSVIRQAVLDLHGNACYCCGESANQVHHRLYDFATLAGYNPLNLIPICGTCHQRIEYDEAGKCTLEQTNIRADESRKTRIQIAILARSLELGEGADVFLKRARDRLFEWADKRGPAR